MILSVPWRSRGVFEWQSREIFQESLHWFNRVKLQRSLGGNIKENQLKLPGIYIELIEFVS